jgi:hypothetical protein
MSKSYDVTILIPPSRAKSLFRILSIGVASMLVAWGLLHDVGMRAENRTLQAEVVALTAHLANAEPELRAEIVALEAQSRRIQDELAAEEDASGVLLEENARLTALNPARYQRDIDALDALLRECNQ